MTMLTLSCFVVLCRSHPNVGWLRDSAALWYFFYLMHVIVAAAEVLGVVSCTRAGQDQHLAGAALGQEEVPSGDAAYIRLVACLAGAHAW